MLNIYRRLPPKEKALVWVAAALVIAILAPRVNGAGLVAGAQVAAALGTFALALLAFRQVEELRETRIAQERPQIIVDLAFSQQLAYVVVRNIGKGAAKDITFDFSAPLEVPDGDPVNELPYFAKGIDYLAPGAELSTLWDSMITLKDFLEERSAHGGITITSRYRSLAGEPHETDWTINPLLLMGMTPMGDASMSELVRVMKDMQKDFRKVVDPFAKELKISTAPEREQRRVARRQEMEKRRRQMEERRR